MILFTKEEHRGSNQILSGVVGKVVQEQPNAAVKSATEIGIAENRVRNGKERGADGHKDHGLFAGSKGGENSGDIGHDQKAYIKEYNAAILAKMHPHYIGCGNLNHADDNGNTCADQNLPPIQLGKMDQSRGIKHMTDQKEDKTAF